MLRSLSGLAARPPLSSSVPTLPLLRTAAIMGKACVLRWAEMKNLECCSEDVISQISILESIQAAGLAATARSSQQAAHSAACHGQIALLNWLKEHNLLSSDMSLWHYATCGCGAEALGWLCSNGYSSAMGSRRVAGAAALRGCRNVLLWTRAHGVRWDEITCMYAAYFGNLPTLQWLRESRCCPWGIKVTHWAREEGHDYVIEWATDNGCPLE